MEVLRVFRNEGVFWIEGSTGQRRRDSVQEYHWWCSGLRCGAEVLSGREITGLKKYLGKKTLQDNYVEVQFGLRESLVVFRNSVWS